MIKDIFGVEIYNEDPYFHEIKNDDGEVLELFIVHAAVDQDVELFFEEKEFVKELRDSIFEGGEEPGKIDEIELNDYEDRFNYEGAVAYRKNGVIVWF